MPDPLKPPTGLRAPGRRLWLSVAERYVLTAAELEMLGQACRTCDELDRLERAVRDKQAGTIWASGSSADLWVCAAPTQLQQAADACRPMPYTPWWAISTLRPLPPVRPSVPVSRDVVASESPGSLRRYRRF